MNMRQHKQSVVARILANGWFNKGVMISSCAQTLDTMFAEMQHVTEHTAKGPSDLVQAFRQGMAEAEVEAAKLEYICLRLKDHVVVDTFDTREEALALVNKHAKQKKAKLYVTTSLGETVVFSEEEFA